MKSSEFENNRFCSMYALVDDDDNIIEYGGRQMCFMERDSAERFRELHPTCDATKIIEIPPNYGTMKMKKSKSIAKEKDYWEFDNPDDMKFILEVNHNGMPVSEPTRMAGATFQIFEYEGKKYELLIMDDGRLGDMVLYEEKDYSHLTFDLFKKTIQDYIDDYDNQMRGLHTEMGFTDEYEPLGDYTFHDNGEGHYTFSYDGVLYEMMNYGAGDFKWGLHDALENAGFEWGVNVEQDTYSDIGFYDPNVRKSTKKMKKSIQDDKDLQYEIRHFGTNLGTTWHGMSGASDYSQFFKEDDRVYRFDHDASGRQTDVEDVTGEDFVIQCPTEAYIYMKNASAKKSYTPEYHDFRTMLTNMKITKDNRTVFKR